MHSKYSALTVALLSLPLDTYAAPAPQDNNNGPPPNLAIQPNNGGGKADDCGNGPISLNPETWKSHNMDQLIGDMFSKRMSDPNFDFHHEFADQYGIDFYCPNSFGNCDSTPSSCASLTKGSATEKEQGWLGIKAMMNVQQLFLQWEKVASNGLDSLSESTVDFQSKFAPKTPGSNLAAKNVFSGIFGLLSLGSAFLGPIAGAVVGGVAAIGSAAQSIGADTLDSNASGELSALKFSDMSRVLKEGTLAGFEATHNATFSNGKAGDTTSATVSLSSSPPPYHQDIPPHVLIHKCNCADEGPSPGRRLCRRRGGAGLRKGRERTDGRLQPLSGHQGPGGLLGRPGGFLVYIPGVTNDCAKWHKNTGGKKDVLRYCGPNGMALLVGVANDDMGGKTYRAPVNVSPENVASIGSYNIPLQSLYESAMNMYTGHGLEAHKDMGYHFNQIIQKYVVEGNQDEAYKTPGFFNLPVCELKSWNWDQANHMPNEAPCDCLCSTDAWGHKFIDNVSDDIKTWVQSNKKCAPCQ
ncbi:hypothetical protein PG996_005005 [Apiospora saccharicola]|uniref:Uncharacterized protein n=1 Tax=Apiospora saccharicola TaxID=335842 RepID=A0ABR1VKA7_9PEZI